MKLIVYYFLGILLIGKTVVGLSQTQPTQNVCVNATTTLQAPTGKPSYSWSLPSTSIAQVMSGGTSTSSSVTLKWINGNGTYLTVCSYSGGTMIWPVNLVYPQPVISGASIVNGSCNTTTVTYSTPVTDAPNYSWGVTGAASYTTSNNGNSTVNWPIGTSGGAPKTGTVSLWYYTPSPRACPSRTTTIPVTINYPAPSAPTGNTSVIGCTVQTYTAASSNVIWYVTGQTNFQANGSIVSVLWPGSGGSGTVRYTIDCTGLSSPTLSVSISPLPEPVLNAQDAYGNPVDAFNLCYNSNSTVLDRVYYTTPGKVQYTWTGYSSSVSSQTGGLTNMGVNGIAHGLASGSYYKDISVRYFEPVGAPFNTTCPSPTKTTRINLLTASIASGLTQVCAPSLNATYTSNDLNYNGVPYSNYFWSAVNGTVTSGQGSPTVNVTWNSSGNAGLNLSYKNNPLSCTSESVGSTSNPTYPVTIRDNIINGQSPVIINTAKAYQFADASGSVTNSFVWNFNGVNTQTVDNNVSITMPGTPGIYALTGTYQLTSGNLNCTTSKSIDVRLPENCVGCAGRKTSAESDPAPEERVMEPTVYPNPANSEIWIRNYPIGSTIHILTGNGQNIVRQISIDENSALKVDASSWASGLHLLKVIKPDGKQVMHKVIIFH